MSATATSNARSTQPGRERFRFGRESTPAAAGDSGWSVDWVLERTDAERARGVPRVALAYAALCALSLWVASSFWGHGAGVVMPLAWLELMGVGALGWAMARHAFDRESIVLRGNRLTVERASGSHVERVEFLPAWVRVEPETGDCSLIELSGQGRRIAVGRFVAPEQRRLLAEELRWALRRWQQGSPRPASM
jgi:uncharacterized membrane protein